MKHKMQSKSLKSRRLPYLVGDGREEGANQRLDELGCGGEASEVGKGLVETVKEFD